MSGTIATKYFTFKSQYSLAFKFKYFNVLFLYKIICMFFINDRTSHYFQGHHCTLK